MITVHPNHLSLSELIRRMERENPAKVLPLGFRAPHSYRGHYEDLAFEPTPNQSVGAMLADARAALGTVYQGWKGGDFAMRDYTYCWLAVRGDCGESIGAVLLEALLAAGQIPGQGRPASPDIPSAGRLDQIRRSATRFREARLSLAYDAQTALEWTEDLLSIVDNLTAERDRARRIAVALEQECAALPEWQCPACGETTRARMADADHGPQCAAERDRLAEQVRRVEVLRDSKAWQGPATVWAARELRAALAGPAEGGGDGD